MNVWRRCKGREGGTEEGGVAGGDVTILYMYKIAQEQTLLESYICCFWEIVMRNWLWMENSKTLLQNNIWS